uniref:Uncharacterized protein n=1 Tax=Romanomermis culicivorax TaxID=13658 RepID=A0A915I9L7_ROMCU
MKKTLYELNESQILKETSFHGLQLVGQSKSRQMALFWTVLTITTLCYASFLIYTEVTSLVSDVKFVASDRAATEVEFVRPYLSLCYSHWTDAVNWADMEAFQIEHNLTVREMIYMLRFYSNTMLDVVTTGQIATVTNLTDDEKNVLREKLNYSTFEAKTSVINLTHSATMIYQCFNDNRTLSKVEKRGKVPRSLGSLCYEFDCWIKKEKTFGGLVALSTNSKNKTSTFYNLLPAFMKPRPSKRGVSMKETCLSTMWSEYSEDHEITSFYENVCFTQDYSVYSVLVSPSLSNIPSLDTVNCVVDKISLPLEPVRKKGVDCYKWKYRMKIFDRGLAWTGINPDSVIVLINTTPYHTWSVLEYGPATQLHHVVASVGGTLGIWTGASIISLLHLLHWFILKVMSFLKRRCGSRSEITVIATKA